MARTPEKSDGAFRTIREVADWLAVPTHVLRFWESKFEQIAPVKGAGGRRYYRPEDMRLLGGIKVMLHDQGLTIRAVGDKIDDEGVEPVMALSPELEMPEGPPARTRRVIRNGDEASAPTSGSDRVVPFDRAAQSATAADTETNETPPPEIESPPADPLAAESEVAAPPDMLADTPPGGDDPVGPMDTALQPTGLNEPDGEDTPPGDGPEPEMQTLRGDPEAPVTESEIAETPSLEATPPENIFTSTDAPESGSPPSAATAEKRTRITLQAAAQTAPPPPTYAALNRVRGAGRIAPEHHRRLKRVVRRLRGLIEDVEEELGQGPNS